MKNYRINIILFVVFFAAVVWPLLYTQVVGVIEGIRHPSGVMGIKELMLLGKSAVMALAVSAGASALGMLFGFLLYKSDLSLRGFFKIVLMFPLFISPYILAVAWRAVLRINHGDWHALIAVIWVLITVYTPLAILIIGSALAGIDKSMEESGSMLTRESRVIQKIIIPLVKPAWASAFVLIFIFSISQFSVPAFFGVKVFTTEIFTRFSAFYDHTAAVNQSLILIIFCIVLLLTEKNYISNAPFISISPKGNTSKIYNLRNKGKWLTLLWSWFSVSIIVPLVFLGRESWLGGGDKIIEAFVLLRPAFALSVGLALAGSVITVIVGFGAAYITARDRGSRIGRWFDAFLLLVFAVPSTVLGIALIKFYNHPGLEWIYGGYAIILFGYAGKFSFIAAKLIGNGIKKIPGSLEESARLLGAGYFSGMGRILLPLLLPVLFTSLIIIFIFSLGELGVTIMIYPPGSEILPIKVFTLMANAPRSLTASMALVVLLVTGLFIVLFFIAAKKVNQRYGFVYDRT